MKSVKLIIALMLAASLVGCGNTTSESNRTTEGLLENSQPANEETSEKRIHMEVKNKSVVNPLELSEGIVPKVDYSKLNAQLAWYKSTDYGDFVTVALESDEPILFTPSMIWIDNNKDGKIEVELSEYGDISLDNKLDCSVQFDKHCTDKTKLYPVRLLFESGKYDSDSLYWADGTKLGLSEDNSSGLKLLEDTQYYIVNENGELGSEFYAVISTDTFKSDELTRQRRFSISNKVSRVPTELDILDTDRNKVEFESIEDIASYSGDGVNNKITFKENTPLTIDDFRTWVSDKVEFVRWKVQDKEYIVPIKDVIIK